MLWQYRLIPMRISLNIVLKWRKLFLLGSGELKGFYGMKWKKKNPNQIEKEDQKGIVSSLIPLCFMYFKNKFSKLPKRNLGVWAHWQR